MRGPSLTTNRVPRQAGQAIHPIYVEQITSTADSEGIEALHEQFRHLWRAVELSFPALLDAGWRAQFETAVGELAANVVRHAYSPLNVADAFMSVAFRLYPDQLEASLIDRGADFHGSVCAQLPPVDDPMALPEGQWGLAMARAAVDHVAYRRTLDGLNEWTIIKLLPRQHN